MSKLFLILFFVMLLSCSQQGQEKITSTNDSLLSEHEMEAVLFDMYLTETLIRQKERELKNNIYYSQHYYTLLFDKHGTDSVVFNRSMQYYATHPILLKQINQNVLDSLIVLETNLGASQ